MTSNSRKESISERIQKFVDSLKELINSITRLVDAIRKFGEAEIHSTLGKIDLVLIFIVLIIALTAPFYLSYGGNGVSILDDILALSVVAVVSGGITMRKQRIRYKDRQERDRNLV